MGERTIAEIIGWPFSKRICMSPDGRPAFEPTVDDLLAWLRDRSELIDIKNHVGYMGRRGWMVMCYRSSNGVDADSYLAGTVEDTLLEALGAAVRVVAGEPT